jgi:hypothetical protein
MSARQFVSFVLVLSCLCCASVAGAQTNAVTLAGVVTDDTGGALPGATVTATNVATGLVRTATTDSAGRYTVLGLPPGSYDVRAELQAFIAVVQRAQQFQVGQTVALDFKLKIGAVSETVEVTAEVPVVQTDSNVVTRVVRTEEVDQLPSLTRDFTQLATLSPGVTVSANNVTIGNGPTNGTGFQVDGTSMQAPTLGGAAIPLVQDWVQEFSVLSSQFPAEFGAAQNGVINAVTRSGTNRTAGRVSAYFQDASLNATLWNATSKQPFGQQRTSAQLGGPIVKDQLLFFGGYERNHSLTNVPVSISPVFASVVPGLSLNGAGTQAVGAVEQDTTIHSIIAKLDYRPGPAHTVTSRFIVRKFDQSANGSATATNVPLTASRGPQYQLNDSSQLAWTWVVSSASLLDSRVELRRNHIQNGCFAAPTPLGFSTSLTAINTPTINYNNAVTLGCAGRWGDAFEKGWFVNEAFTTTRGPHTLKVGGMFVQPLNHVVETQNQNGTYTMPSVALFNAANAATYPIAYSISFEPGAQPGWALGGNQYGLFAQDTWRLGQGLTLSLGLRYDAEAKVSSLNDAVDEMKPPYNTHLNHVDPNNGNVAPRVGFTWTPGGTTRLAIRGGFGVFYDTAKNATFAAWAGQVGNPLTPGGLLMSISANTATLNPYCLGNTRCAAGVPADLQSALRQVIAAALINNTVPNLAATSVTVNGVTTTLPGVAISPIPLSLAHVDQHLQTPLTRQETIGAQFDLGRGLSASADLKFIQGRDQYILRNVNVTSAGQIIDPVFQALNSLGNGGELDVKQLLVQGGYRSRRGDSVQVAYALGKATNNAYNNFGAGPSAAQTAQATNPFDYSVDVGPASNDLRNILNISSNFALPLGISFAPLFRATSGAPVNPTTNGRPSVAQGCQVFYAHCYPFNTTTGQVVGRNSFVGDANWTLNARLSKEMRFGTRRLTAMLEGFNLTNRVNYTGYNGSIGGTTGLVTDLSGIVPNAADLMRQVQIGFRFDF